MFNFWASRKGLENIRYAKPGANGGAEARAILADPEYANRVAIPEILQTESDFVIGDMVKQIYGRMQKRMANKPESDEGAKGALKLGRAGIVGWDLVELTDLSWTITRRREVRPARKTLTDMKPSWMPLTKVVPIFFGQFMGESITPVRPSEVCRHWYPIPGGLKNNYLAASVRCISALANYFGHNRCWFLPENLRWLYKDESLFRPCVNCISDPTICVKMPQALEPAASKLHRRNSGMISLLPQVSDDGAVVFASQRKDVKFLDMTWINNYIVVLITPIGISNLGWKYYLIYAVLNAVFVPVVGYYYVETAGLSLEEIDKVFESEYTEGRPENELISGEQPEKEHFEQVAHF